MRASHLLPLIALLHQIPLPHAPNDFVSWWHYIIYIVVQGFLQFDFNKDYSIYVVIKRSIEHTIYPLVQNIYLFY